MALKKRLCCYTQISILSSQVCGWFLNWPTSQRGFFYLESPMSTVTLPLALGSRRGQESVQSV